MKSEPLLAFNTLCALCMGACVGARLNPQSYDFRWNAAVAGLLFLASLFLGALWAKAWSDRQRRVWRGFSPARFHRLQRALYRKASLNSSLTR